MSFHFYLSYAPADYSEDLQGFFTDLSSTINLLRSDEEATGFFDPPGVSNGSEWRGGVSEALRTSQTMVALISPEYLRSDSAGKEWQIFEMRRNPGGNLQASAIPEAIAPIVWIPCDHLPKTVSDAAGGLSHLNGAYRQNGLLVLRRSLDRFQDEYVKTLVALAKHLIGMARTAKLPALDALPDFDNVDSAFNPSHELFPSLARESEKGSKYRAVIVEDDRQVREMLQQFLTFHGFECESYADATVALNQILKTEPDVLLVDLELEPNQMQGLKLIERLTVTDDPPSIIGMSAGLSNSELIEALKCGADDVIAKPFDIFQILERIKTLADIGRNRRLYKKKKKDDDRDRPVFLSYSFKDRRTAAILRTQIESRGIGVWYASDVLEPEDPIMDRISHGLDRAQVFIPLITDNYPRSSWCAFEMTRFSESKTDKSRVVFPVLEGVKERIRNQDLIRAIMYERDVVDITFDRFADGLTALLGRIQQALGKNGV